jgi:copper chaperone CopZ
VYRALGGRTLAVYLGTIIAGSMGAGLLFDSLLPVGALALPEHHGEDPAWWELGSAVVLSAMMLWFALSDLRSLIARKTAASRPESIELAVAGMTCNGCRTKLESALLGTDGVDAAVVILEPGSARIWGTLDAAGLSEAVDKAGFTPLAGSGE